MLQACRRLADLAFREMNLNRLEVFCAEANVKSRKIPEQLGFTLEGKLRDAHFLYDHYVDYMLYAMLQRDWTFTS
jgi:ribosomal-protein-serine acetyltransferase